ncbi:hypothetical protein O3M35_002373 [Rhynocoris fuscipes]|uniref:Uncharacterized protein n=1 Tax=Rhynocoris fuscipes TaxID=488301 RepID=A0AAW1CSS8_9HEMI
MRKVKQHPCLSDVVQKLIKSKLSNIRMEYKKILKLPIAVLKIWWTKFANFSYCIGNTVGLIDWKF